MQLIHGVERIKDEKNIRQVCMKASGWHKRASSNGNAKTIAVATGSLLFASDTWAQVAMTGSVDGERAMWALSTAFFMYLLLYGLLTAKLWASTYLIPLAFAAMHQLGKVATHPRFGVALLVLAAFLISRAHWDQPAPAGQAEAVDGWLIMLVAGGSALIGLFALAAVVDGVVGGIHAGRGDTAT